MPVKYGRFFTLLKIIATNGAKPSPRSWGARRLVEQERDATATVVVESPVEKYCSIFPTGGSGQTKAKRRMHRLPREARAL